jgi:hypothetical protein
MLLRRPGTQLLAVVVANTVAYLVSQSGGSAMAIMTYLLQMLLLYRVWRGANLIPWLLLMAITIYEAYCVYTVLDNGAAATHPLWFSSHASAVGVTVLVLIGPDVRRRLGALRGPKAARWS